MTPLSDGIQITTGYLPYTLLRLASPPFTQPPLETSSNQVSWIQTIFLLAVTKAAPRKLAARLLPIDPLLVLPNQVADWLPP